MSSRICLYHTGYQEIRRPDIRFGRRNADFGQGFYLTRDSGFALRWARERPGMSAYVNCYELDLSGLRIHRFRRDEAWYDYIFRNRAGGADALPEADVIIGPIANDTIYDTFGVLTSGLMDREESLRMLSLGPAHEQTVIKSDRAAAQLTWISARVLTSSEIAGGRALAKEEEADYQRALASIFQ